jgi:hypothetical protein
MNRVAVRVLDDGRLEVLGSSLRSLGGNGHRLGSVVEVLARPEAHEVSASELGYAVVSERTFLGSLTRLRVTLDDDVALLVDAASRRDRPPRGRGWACA